MARRQQAIPHRMTESNLASVKWKRLDGGPSDCFRPFVSPPPPPDWAVESTSSWFHLSVACHLINLWTSCSVTSKGGANDAVGLVNSTTSPRSGPGPLITRRKEDLSRQKSHAATCFAVLFFFAHFVFSTAKSFGPNKGRRQSSCNQSHLSSSRERERV